jgi:GNAT superfamily N-acetyltransferase
MISMNGLQIRDATGGDLPAVMRLVDAVIADMRSRAIEQWDAVYPAADVFSADIAAGTLHVCAVAGDPMAAVFVLDEHHVPEWTVTWTATAGAAVVHRLMVHPRHQGRGVAQALMDYAERLARDRGYTAIHLDCFSQNPQALNLYRRRGYGEAGTVMLRKGVFHCFEKSLR